jgi:multidrug transporter EmrE-like cation transporter
LVLLLVWAKPKKLLVWNQPIGCWVFNLPHFKYAFTLQSNARVTHRTAYAVWTGIGAVGTVLVRIVVFKEPATFGESSFNNFDRFHHRIKVCFSN